ncbi:MAG: DUF2911 domain-containing protein [Candidatus Hydrogenedentes bacterium]|nr:DUF2911 domain-containing protein [Candidatus Hydrogenedentota bacterium]
MMLNNRFSIHIFTVLGLTIALLCALGTPAYAAEAIPTDLDVADAQSFIGKWTITIDFGGREMSVLLNVKDIDGKVGATLDSARQSEPQAIQQIAKTDDGLALGFEMKFGQNAFPMTINIQLNGDDTIVGTISDENNLFNSTLRGIRDFSAEIEGDRPNPTDTRLMISEKFFKITFTDLTMDSDDFARLQETKSGDIFHFVGGRATKLFTDADLDFGDAIVKTENVAKDYPGVYSLWLKKVDEGWHLVFNNEPDIWGTQHNAEADAAEIALVTNTLDEPQDAFVMKLEENDKGFTLRIAWGTNEWMADFSLAQ